MILDYSEYIIRKGIKGILSGVTQDNNIDVFYANTGNCPFCDIKINEKQFSESRTIYPDWIEGSFSEYEYVYQCPICGWWEYIYENSSDAMLEYTRLSELKIHTSVLRKYEIDSQVVPIEVLNQYIRNNPNKMYNIHHKKMEELTQAVFREHYDCEVELVGQSHDGGKDLILVNGNSQTLVQVKRRTIPDKVEPVSSVRELLGATVLERSRSCIFVTTADHFSGMAVKAAGRAKELKIVDEYELIDYHRFVDMLNLHNIPVQPWAKLITMTSYNN